LLLLAVPIIDTLTVFAQRLREGRSPFVADRNHLHHRLLDLGLDHHEAVAAIYLAQIAFTIAAWFMRYESDVTIVAVFAITATALSALVLRGRRRVRRSGSPTDDPAAFRLGAFVKRRFGEGQLRRWATRAVVIALLVYSSITVVGAAVTATDIRLLAVAVAIGLAVFVWLRGGRGSPNVAERAALYVGIVLIAYADLTWSTRPPWVAIAQWVLFPLLAAGVALNLRLSPQRFNITPLDVLVLFLALIIPNLPGTIVYPDGFGVVVAKVVTLFYAVETALWNDDRVGRWSSGVAAIMLTFVAARGLLV
jgi:UDP-GlcNAc:undecaprenyl-phosphate GlcNAc-1-phosphate transferase